MNIPTRFARLGLTALLAFTLVAGAGIAPSRAQEKAPYTIDAILDLTGANGFAGSIYASALRLLEKDVNQHGGIYGRPLHIEIHDDQTNPKNAVQLAADVIAHKPVAFFGGNQTASCAAIAAMVKDGPVDFCISPGFFPKAGTYAFASSASLHSIVGAVIRFARLKGYRRIAVIAATDASGQSSDQAVEFSLAQPENRDVKVVSWQHFNPGDLSVAAQVARIKDAGPNVIFAFVGGTAFGTVLRNLSDAGVQLPVVTSAANLNPAQLDEYKSFRPPALYFNGSIYQERDELRPGMLRNTVDEFLATYKSAGEIVSPNSGLAWDPAWILVNALRKLGPNVTSEQLRSYLSTAHNIDGVNGTYDFRIGDQHGLTDMQVPIVRWDADRDTFPPASKPGGAPLPARK